MIGKKYLKGGQVKLDANKDGKISAADFSMLRKGMKKYQEGGKAPDMESRKERMYLEIRKDAERMEKEMKRQGMSQEEINKKLDAYMEKAMKDAQYSTNMKKQYSKGGKMYQRGGKVKKGSKKNTTSEKEIDLGSTIRSKNRMTLGEVEELNRRTEKRYGQDPASVRSGYEAIDRRLDEKEQSRREARARAGNKYYDGDGGGAARREKAYADELEARIYGKMTGEKYDAYREKSKKEDVEKGLKAVDAYNKSKAKMRKGGKVVKYQRGGKTTTHKRDIKKEAAQKERDDLNIQRKMARSEYYDALRNRQSRLKELEGKTNDGASNARENLDKEVARTFHNFRVSTGDGHGGGESLRNGQYEMKISRKHKPRKGFQMDEKKGATELVKYQGGGKTQSAKKERDTKLTGKEDPAKLSPKKRAEFIKKYAKKKRVVKYQNGGENPTPTERTYTPDETRMITSPGNQPSASYKGYEKEPTPKQILETTEMFRIKDALKKRKYAVNGLDLAAMRKIAKTKGFYDDAVKLARQDYQKEMDKRKQ